MMYFDKYRADKDKMDMAARVQIVKQVTGSLLYGTNDDDSDKDIFILVSPSLGEYLLCHRRKGKFTSGDDRDQQLVTLPHYYDVLSKGSAVFNDVLFAPISKIYSIPNHSKWDRLYNNRLLFLGKHVYLAYYYSAIGTLKKVGTSGVPSSGADVVDCKALGLALTFALNGIRLVMAPEEYTPVLPDIEANIVRCIKRAEKDDDLDDMLVVVNNAIRKLHALTQKTRIQSEANKKIVLDLILDVSMSCFYKLIYG